MCGNSFSEGNWVCQEEVLREYILGEQEIEKCGGARDINIGMNVLLRVG